MALRTFRGCLMVVTLAVCASTACKDDEDAKGAGSATPPGQSASAASGGPLGKRCEQLGKACGEKDKHQEKITDECKQAARKYVEKGCADKVVALYDCYEKEICSGLAKVWALDDFRVLAERHSKCAAE